MAEIDPDTISEADIGRTVRYSRQPSVPVEEWDEWLVVAVMNRRFLLERIDDEFQILANPRRCEFVE